MKTLMERAIVEALLTYMEKKGINQNELAQILGWAPSDLNDTLKGRKGIGKNRQALLEDKLGELFKDELLLKINEISGVKKMQPTKIAEFPSKYKDGKGIIADLEQEYIKTLLSICRGKKQRAKPPLKTTINPLSHQRKKKNEI